MTQTRARTPPNGQARGSGPRLEPKASVRLTGRGALAAMTVFCFVTQLIADWTGWGTLAGAAFVCGCGTITYYTRTSGLRTVVVAPPLLFFAGSVCAEVLTASGKFVAAEGIVVTLGTSAPWLFTGTVLTVVVAIGRGYRPGRPPVVEARAPGDRSSRGSANVMSSGTASTSSTASKP
jgi:hypothetical protein